MLSYTLRLSFRSSNVTHFIVKSYYYTAILKDDIHLELAKQTYYYNIIAGYVDTYSTAMVKDLHDCSYSTKFCEKNSQTFTKTCQFSISSMYVAYFYENTNNHAKF